MTTTTRVAFVDTRTPDLPRGRWLLRLTVVTLVLGQRFAIPLGGDRQVPLTVVAMLLFAYVGLRSGTLLADTRRCRLLGFALSVAAVLTAVSVALQAAPSLLSLLLLLLIYLPAVTVAADRRAAFSALRTFVDLMTVLAIVGLATFGLQYVGVPYRDYFADFVPASFVQQGYNTAYPLSYGSAIFRSNGVFFLEASFFSLFLALAAIVSLRLSYRTRWLPVLAGACVCTASGNGIVFLAVCVLFVALFGPDRRKLQILVLPAALAGVLIVLTPLGSLLAGRTTEVTSPGSSASLRLVEPYEVLLPAYMSSTSSILVGNGAGTADDYIAAANGPSAVIAPAVPKLLYEFGLLGTLPILAFLLVTFLERGARMAWMPGLLLGFFVINAGLQQPTIAAATYLFLSTLACTTPSREPRTHTPIGSTP